MKVFWRAAGAAALAFECRTVPENGRDGSVCCSVEKRGRDGGKEENDKMPREEGPHSSI